METGIHEYCGTGHTVQFFCLCFLRDCCVEEVDYEAMIDY